jgi:hypothetical protein
MEELKSIRFNRQVKVTPEQLYALECRNLRWFEETEDPNEADFVALFDDGSKNVVRYYKVPSPTIALMGLVFRDGPTGCWKLLLGIMEEMGG